jgi:hypothetical protein
VAGFKIGDIVTPRAEKLQNYDTFWKNAKLEIVDFPMPDMCTAKILEISDNPRIKKGRFTDWLCSDLEIYIEKSDSNQCVCELQTLMTKGCQCGGE